MLGAELLNEANGTGSVDRDSQKVKAIKDNINGPDTFALDLMQMLARHGELTKDAIEVFFQNHGKVIDRGVLSKALDALVSIKAVNAMSQGRFELSNLGHTALQNKTDSR